MKCLSCDVILADAEAVRKYDDFDEYVDLCDSCYRETDLNTNDDDTVVTTDGEEEDAEGYGDPLE